MSSNQEGKIYVAQTHLTLELDCDSDLSDASTVIIKYTKPDGTTGSWTDNINITDPVAGLVERTVFAPGDLDQSGEWIVWAYATYNDSSVAPGEPDMLQVFDEGD